MGRNLPDQNRRLFPRDELGVDGVVDIDFDGSQVGRFDWTPGREVDSRDNYRSGLVVITQHNEVRGECENRGEEHEEMGCGDNASVGSAGGSDVDPQE